MILQALVRHLVVGWASPGRCLRSLTDQIQLHEAWLSRNSCLVFQEGICGSQLRLCAGDTPAATTTVQLAARLSLPLASLFTVPYLSTGTAVIV